MNLCLIPNIHLILLLLEKVISLHMLFVRVLPKALVFYIILFLFMVVSGWEKPISFKLLVMK